MALKKRVGPIHVSAFEEARIIKPENSRPQIAADRVIQRIPDNRRRDQQKHQGMHVEFACGGKRSRHEQQRVAGQERRDDHAGFQENNEKKDCVNPGAVRLGQLPQMLVQVKNQIEKTGKQVHRGSAP